jgi:Protein of unknown function (DUF3606)
VRLNPNPPWIERSAPLLNPRQTRNKEDAMADDKSKTGAPDRDRINLNEDYELRYWR